MKLANNETKREIQEGKPDGNSRSKEKDAEQKFQWKQSPDTQF